jgi:hypothetical protein
MKRLFLFIISGILAFSCQGPEGPMGPPGPAGRDGADGNANVYTQYLEITTNMWFVDTITNTLGVEMEVSVISDAIAERGAVNVFYHTYDVFEGIGEYFALPFTYRSNDGQLVTETYGFGPQYVKIEIQGHDSIPDIPNDDYIYKVVIIEE